MMRDQELENLRRRVADLEREMQRVPVRMPMGSDAFTRKWRNRQAVFPSSISAQNIPAGARFLWFLATAGGGSIDPSLPGTYAISTPSGTRYVSPTRNRGGGGATVLGVIEIPPNAAQWTISGGAVDEDIQWLLLDGAASTICQFEAATGVAAGSAALNGGRLVTSPIPSFVCWWMAFPGTQGDCARWAGSPAVSSTWNPAISNAGVSMFAQLCEVATSTRNSGNGENQGAAVVVYS
jgi:hypothetical protein